MATKAQGNDCYENVGPDEPVFTLRARDPFAAFLVRQWISLAKSAGVNGMKIVDAEETAYKMERFIEKKIPD